MTSTPEISEQERERLSHAYVEELERLREEVARWRARYAKAEKRDLAFVNSEGEVEPVYTALDLEHLDPAAVPGEYPYTRGIHPSGDSVPIDLPRERTTTHFKIHMFSP